MKPLGSAVRTALLLSAVLVLVRSFVFVFFEQAHFDADQAVFGLMARHLAHLSAFPVFMYGQRYLLAVSVWLTAPFVAVFGTQVFALKLPMLLLNLLVAGLLVVGLHRESSLPPAWALWASFPFVMPPVAAAVRLVEHQGGIIEPFVSVLLLWWWRDRPLLFGLVAGIGYLNREVAAYGVVAALVVEALEGRLFARESLRAKLIAAAACAAVVMFVHVLAVYSSNAFGTAPHVHFKGWGIVGPRVATLYSTDLPVLFGLTRTPLAQVAVPGDLMVGLPIPVALSFLFVLLLAARTAWLCRRRREAPTRLSFPLYLLLVGTITIASYVILGRGIGGVPLLRYLLLSLLLPVGLLALHRSLEPRPLLRKGVAVAVVLWAAANLVDHIRVIATYLLQPPPSKFRILAENLQAQGVVHGIAPYWVAYPVDYLSAERVKLTASGMARIREYHESYREHRSEAVRIEEAPCTAGRAVADWCVVGPPAPPGRANGER